MVKIHRNISSNIGRLSKDLKVEKQQYKNLQKDIKQCDLDHVKGRLLSTQQKEEKSILNRVADLQKDCHTLMKETSHELKMLENLERNLGRTKEEIKKSPHGDKKEGVDRLEKTTQWNVDKTQESYYESLSALESKINDLKKLALPGKIFERIMQRPDNASNILMLWPPKGSEEALTKFLGSTTVEQLEKFEGIIDKMEKRTIEDKYYKGPVLVSLKREERPKMDMFRLFSANRAIFYALAKEGTNFNTDNYQIDDHKLDLLEKAIDKGFHFCGTNPDIVYSFMSKIMTDDFIAKFDNMADINAIYKELKKIR